jgi:hypothetical protein
MAALNGFHPVDLFEITKAVADYLESRGAEVDRGTGSLEWYRVQFPGCKRPVDGGHGNTVRIFFPNEEEIMLFSMVFGHLIQNTRVKALHEMILEQRFGIHDA